jgi:DNA polymerase III psi subunit
MLLELTRIAYDTVRLLRNDQRLRVWMFKKERLFFLAVREREISSPAMGEISLGRDARQADIFLQQIQKVKKFKG